MALGEWAGKRAPDVAPSPPLVARRRLAETFGVASLDAFGSFSDAEAIAGLMAVDYVRATQAGTLPRLARPSPQGSAGLLAMDAATRASLEIHRARDGGAMHTLMGTVQRTLTPAGARMLAGWLAAPLTDPAAIAARQTAWGWLLAEHDAAAGLRAALRSAPDIARALGRLSVARGGPRDLAAVRDGLRAARAAEGALRGKAGKESAVELQFLPLPLREGVGGRGPLGRRGPLPPTPSRKGRGRFCPPIPALLQSTSVALQCRCFRWNRLLTASLADPAPHRLDDGNAIRPGFDAELDAERALRDDSRRVLATLQLD